MNPRIPPVLSVLLLALAFLVSFAAAQADFEYGARPPQSVFDPQNQLDPAVAAEIATPLEGILRNEDVDIMVVVLPSLDNAPPEHVAGRFAAAWSKSPIHAVVLHVPGHKDTPWIVPSGRLLATARPEMVRQKLADGTRNVAREPDENSKVRAAATEAADMLRYLMHNAINRREFLETERTRIRLDLENKALRKRILLLGSAVSVFVVLFALAWLLLHYRRPGPRLFPDARPPRRLGAPHCGGNHAVVDLGPPPSSRS